VPPPTVTIPPFIHRLPHVIDVLPTVLVVAALLAAAWAVVLVAVDRLVGTFLLGYLALVELGLLALSVAGFVNLAGTDRDVNGLSFGGYLVGVLFILPVGGVWALAERSRWGAGVLAVACLTIPVMILRMNQIWTGA